MQCNLVILPAAHARDFADFCQANQAACPVLAQSQPGDPTLPELGRDLDLRTDLGSYRLFRDGRSAGDVADIRDLWRDDFVAFAFGCSFSFEQVLAREGVDMRFLARGDTAALYVSELEATPVGPFGGKIAVSMRPLRPRDSDLAIAVTARYPTVHGAPVHVGDPSLIGIADLERDAIERIGRTRVLDDEVPVFWACGVTSQLALESAALPIAITHTPAYMLVTDLPLEKTKTVPGGDEGALAQGLAGR